MTVVNGTFFIVPNAPFTLADDIAESTKDSILRTFENVGVTVEENEKLLEVWYTSSSCDNWTSHPWGENPEFFGSNGLPQHLPQHLLEGIKEGEELTLQWGEKVITVRAAQLGSRYRRFGSFDHVVQRLLSL
jgi:hypothetical protein